MHSLTRIAAGLAFLAITTPALAEGPRIVGGGDNMTIVRDPAEQSGNIVGGGRTVLRNGSTGGISASYQDTMPSGSYGLPSLTGGGDDASVAYAPAGQSARGGLLANRR